MTDYVITTPRNPEYTGKTYGVLFQHGRAYLSEHTIEPALGYTVEQIARRMRDEFGYEVESVEQASAKKRGKAGAKKASEVEADETEG